ncbi:DUF418 domain-containing protein [Methylopila sp. M107]|uniref:DUF418 domain-containing protein n=1 Tax=Methylopila sp. M107 TaxID=1101190 RepID=UPI000362EE42|nr:DUF418 domain-containing protein [Methylopila sp. M107]
MKAQARQPQRDGSIDALRAVALFGILAVNLPFLALPGGFAGVDWEKTGPSLADLLSAGLIQGLFESKFILIFSALFGFGAWRQMSRHGVGRYSRRLVALGAFGVAHAALLFEADILLPYAVMGGALLLFRERSTRIVIASAVAFWSLAVIGNGLFGVKMTLDPPSGGGSGETAHVLATGGYAEIAAVRMRNWASFQTYSLWSNYPLSLAAMLFGLAAGRLAEREGAGALVDRARRLAFYALVPAVLGNLLYCVLASIPSTAGGSKLFLLTLALRPLFAPFLSVVLVAVGLTLLKSPKASSAVALLSPAGGTSMSIYLGFSIVSSVIFYGYGFGLHGEATLSDSLWISAAIFAAFIAAAHLWRRRFAQGPAEAAMSALTNAAGSGRSGPASAATPRRSA